MRRSAATSVLASLLTAALAAPLAAGTAGATYAPAPDYATFVGGSDYDGATAVAVGPAGSVFVSGFTQSRDFPSDEDPECCNGEMFVARMSSTLERFTYSRVFTGTNAYAADLHPMPDGDVIVVGATYSESFPVTSGAPQQTHGGHYRDAFAMRLQAGGSIDWATYLGGSGNDGAVAVDVGSDGDVFVAGMTESCDFPFASSGSRTGDDACGPDSYEHDVWVVRLTPDGATVEAGALFGGNGDDWLASMRLGPGDDPVLVGETNSTDLATPGAFQTSHAGGGEDAFALRADAALDRVEWATYLGGEFGDGAKDVAVEPDGDAIVVGDTSSGAYPTTEGAYQEEHPQAEDCVGREYEFELDCDHGFVTEIGADGSYLKFSTYVGGDGFDTVRSVSLDDDGRPFLTGWTLSSDFPVNRSAETGVDAFYAVLSKDGNHLLAGARLAGDRPDYAHDTWMRHGKVWIAGATRSSDFPTTAGAYDATFNGDQDAFLVAFDASDHAGAGETTFTHGGGNEWWVQVDVTPKPDRVQARDEGGAWVELEFRDWGEWAESFHIEPGHDVQFRALYGSEWTKSCWFTHPEGAIASCEASGGGDDDGPVVFDHRGGNEWWVQVDVEPHADRVQARDEGGAWVELELRDWGEWAESFHVEPGHEVQFRALHGSEWTESCWFTHPEGDPTACGDGDAAFAATFHGVRGNEWWIETEVDANEPLAAVDARIDGGAWRPLEPTDWGSWAESYHAPEGSTVEFRATSTGGERVVSGAYAWPPG